MSVAIVRVVAQKSKSSAPRIVAVVAVGNGRNRPG